MLNRMSEDARVIVRNNWLDLYQQASEADKPGVIAECANSFPDFKVRMATNLVSLRPDDAFVEAITKVFSGYAPIKVRPR